MNNTIPWHLSVLIFWCLLNFNCRNESETVKSIYKFIPPGYKDLKLIPRQDSIHFSLSENTYNEIKSFNYFIDNKTECISFYDGRSATINIYDFLTQQRIKKIKVKKWLKGKSLYKTSVYVKNFDSIFITNQKTLYLFDSSGVYKSSIEFNKRNDQLALFNNLQPPVIDSGIIFMGVRPWVSETSFSELKRWRIVYGFNLKDSTKHLYYSLPENYLNNIYGHQFLNYNYCHNGKYFVFSFPADANVYETDFKNYHVAYHGKSRFQNGEIMPVPVEALKNDNGYREFRLRDSYGPIYYDEYRKRYLRLARQRISEAEYLSKEAIKRQSLIIFDEKFKIISEHKMNETYSFGSLFFTKDGSIYARVNSKDEYALHFVQLAYLEDQHTNSELTKNK